MATPLSKDQIETALGELPGWSADGDSKITKTFKFSHFREAMSFIVRVGMEAEKKDHHPELFNVYNTVKIGLSTHDAGDKVTGNDIELARIIESFSWV